MKRRRKNIKIIIAVTGLLIIGLLTVSAAVINQKLIKSETNDFTPAEISIAVQENESTNTAAETEMEVEWVLSEDENTYMADKEVQILNVDMEKENNGDAWVRVCMIPRWTGKDPTIKEENEEDEVTNTNWNITYDSLGADPESLTGITIKNNSYQLNDVTFLLDSMWSEEWFFNVEDGYFYCKNKIAPGGTTPRLLSKVAVSKEKLDDDYKGLSLQIDILSDAIQTEGGAVKARWKTVHIDENGQLAKGGE